MTTILTHLQTIACPEIRRRAVADLVPSDVDYEAGSLKASIYYAKIGEDTKEGDPFWQAFAADTTLTFDDLKHLLPAAVPVTDGWISVKDRLPELGSRVLVVEQGGLIQICNYGKQYYNGKSSVLAFHDEADEQPSICNPTHWQPLPPAPQSSSTD